LHLGLMQQPIRGPTYDDPAQKPGHSSSRGVGSYVCE
jgi:hypothetical protein